MSTSPVDRLLQAGFERVATWHLADDAIVIPDVLRRAPAVYAFVVDDEIRYIGSASQHLPRRMRQYAAQGKLSVAGRLNGFIREELHLGRRVEVLAAFPEPATWQDLPIDLVLGRETGLIREFQPAWNRRGNGKRR
jgi:hypothetical protein